MLRVALLAVLSLTGVLGRHTRRFGDALAADLERVEEALDDELAEEVAPRTRHHRKRWFTRSLAAVPPELERREGSPCSGMDNSSPEYYCCMKEDGVSLAKNLGHKPPGTLLAGSVNDAPATVGQCVEAMTNCFAVMINVEGSDDLRRRANTQNNLNAFGVNYRCSVLFYSMVKTDKKETLEPPETAAFNRGMLTACVLKATKNNVKEMLTSLAASKKQVMLILSTHGGLMEARYRGKGNEAQIGDEHLSKDELKTDWLAPFCGTPEAKLLVVWSACFSGGYFAKLTAGGETIKKSQNYVFEWSSPDDADIQTRVDALKTVTIAYSGSHSSGSACEGKAGGGAGDNVAVLTGSFPHKPQVSNSFSDGSIGDGTVFEGGNALHVAFRKIAREQEGITLKQLDKALIQELKRQDTMRDSEGGPFCCAARYQRDGLIYQKQKDTCEHEMKCAGKVIKAPVTDWQFTMALTDASIGETNNFKMVACSVDTPATCENLEEKQLRHFEGFGGYKLQSKIVHKVEGFDFYPFIAGTLDNKVADYFPLHGLRCDSFEGVRGQIALGADDKFNVAAECQKLAESGIRKEWFGFRNADECCASRLMEYPLATFNKVKDEIAPMCVKMETPTSGATAPLWQVAGFRETAEFTGQSDCWAAYLRTADDDAKWKVDLETRFKLRKTLFIVNHILEGKKLTCPAA